MDVPYCITSNLLKDRGRINIKGTINQYPFTKTLMPVKNSKHRLFVNKEMMKGGSTQLGKIANFIIEQNFDKKVIDYPIPPILESYLIKQNLSDKFNKLTKSNKRSILKYLNYIKTEKTLIRNIDKLIIQLKENKKKVSIP